MIYPWPGGRGCKNPWTTEPTNVEKLGDELWGGVKVKSNLEISRSLRNSFRASLENNYFTGVELLIGIGGLPVYPPLPNSEYCKDYLGSQSMGDNIRGQEGNNPDRQLRSQIHAELLRKSNCCDNQDVGLEAATI